MKKLKPKKSPLKDVDKDLYNLIKRKKSEKYFLITMILEEIEETYDIDVKEFEYKNKRLTVKVDGKNYVCIDLSEDL
jgi:hypothetical protein